MIARRIGWLMAAATLAASATYVFVYLYRWEWNRALMASALFIVAEIGLVAMLMARRLTKIEQRLDAATVTGRHQTVQHLRASAPPPRVRFEWLSRPDQLNVFVPVLLGAGAVLSGLAWLVERMARVTARPVAEHALAARLDDLQLPSHGFLDDAGDPFALLRGPVGGAP